MNLNLKLGLSPHVPDRRDLHLVNFFYDFIEPMDRRPIDPLQDFGHGDLVPEDGWGMLGNDRFGCCAEAGAAHETMVLGREGMHSPQFDEDCVLGAYEEITGFIRDEPRTDQGTEPRQLAAFRRHVGIPTLDGKRHRIGAYLWLERGNIGQLWAALSAFGVVGIGYELPEQAVKDFQLSRDILWDYAPGSPILGGHYVPAVGRRDGCIDSVSWGARISITPGFYERYCQCALCYISASALGPDGKTPDGLDRERLLRELEKLKEPR